jgi:hypothetical protein
MSTTASNVTLSALDLETLRTRAEHDLPGVERFASKLPASVPARLRTPYSRADWLALSPGDRRAHLGEQLLAQHAARALARKARKLETARGVMPSTPTPDGPDDEHQHGRRAQPLRRGLRL